MDDDNAKLAEAFVSRRYIRAGMESGLTSTHHLLRGLLTNRRIPDDGWSEGAWSVPNVVQAPAEVKRGEFESHPGESLTHRVKIHPPRENARGHREPPASVTRTRPDAFT